jgi:adenosine deaminase
VTVASAFEIFKIVSQVLVDLDTLERVVKEIVADYAKQNCVYLELRSTPKVFKDKLTGETSSLGDYVGRVIKAMKEAEEEHSGKIRVRYIASINRGAPIDFAN